MVLLILGLALFLGLHSVRVFAEGWRGATIARIGEKRWKGIYSLVSIVGFVLLVWGFIRARGAMELWDPPAFMRYVTAVLMLPVFVIFVAARVPRNAIKARLHHPQVLAVKLWAFAHLLSNGSLADVILFGSFLVWAVLSFAAARKRDRAAGTVYPPGTARGTIVCVIAGLAIYALFLIGLHRWLFGVSPLA
ncbi:MAG TPA: NnrU family protein [Usitatibacter sp.]|nr:NnrU family protein [Usitatibacter sp.]